MRELYGEVDITSSFSIASRLRRITLVYIYIHNAIHHHIAISSTNSKARFLT
jgi:hypothetical protein